MDWVPKGSVPKKNAWSVSEPAQACSMFSNIYSFNGSVYSSLDLVNATHTFKWTLHHSAPSISRVGPCDNGCNWPEL